MSEKTCGCGCSEGRAAQFADLAPTLEKYAKVPGSLITSGAARFQVLPTHEKWFGMTYIDDLPATRNGIKALRDGGIYPEKLW